MSTGERTPLAQARKIVEELVDLLAYACERIQIAGSIRRERPDIGDGEIVVIPVMVGDRNLLHERLDLLVADGRVKRAKIIDKNKKVSERWGAKMRTVEFEGMKVDIFFTDEESWGYQFLLRTGPGDANEYIMTRARTAPFSMRGGAVWVGDVRVPIREEKDFFMIMGMPYIEPKDRYQAKYMEYLGRGKNHKWGNPRSLIPFLAAPAPAIRLLWRYSQDVLNAFPIPLEFRDEESGKTWANLSVDRFHGEWVLVEQGSQEEKFQHEFLVGAVQRRFELERLRRHLWQDEKLAVPGFVDMSDLPETYFVYLPGSGTLESVPLSKVIPTQSTVYRWGVHTKSAPIERQRAGLFNVPWEPGAGIRFAGSDLVYLTDGHHKLVCAQQYGVDSMNINVVSFGLTLEEARAASDGDDTNYNFLADVLEEAAEILAEGKVIA